DNEMNEAGINRRALGGRPLTPVSVPDRTRRLVVPAFTPYHVSVSEVIDGHGEVVAEGEAETAWPHIIVAIVAPCCAGELCLGRPRGAAVARTAMQNIPQRSVTRVHPRDAHIAGNPGNNRRKAVFTLIVGARALRFCEPARPAGGRGGK